MSILLAHPVCLQQTPIYETEFSIIMKTFLERSFHIAGVGESP